MKKLQEAAPTNAKTSRKGRDTRLSPDGKWKSFPKVPHLLQYVPTAVFYARIKVHGKLVRRRLKTDVYTTALLRLSDFLKEQRSKPARTENVPVNFAEARRLFEARLEARHDMKPRAKEYRRGCINILLKTWPDLAEMKLSKISETACQEWAHKFLAEGYNEHYFNQTLSTLRHILDCGELNPNPAKKVKRRGVKLRELRLPEQGQFENLLENMDHGGGGNSRKCADLVRFLAFSGCRLEEARNVKWSDVDLNRGYLSVENAKRRLTSDKSRVRKVPIIRDLRALLERLAEAKPQPSDSVCQVHESQKALTRACRELGISRITHHDLRHLFATRCIESGVDVPTVSRWLGHQDGGALAMRVYGHLRDQHSAAMAEKVSFSTPPIKEANKVPEQSVGSQKSEVEPK